MFAKRIIAVLVCVLLLAGGLIASAEESVIRDEDTGVTVRLADAANCALRVRPVEDAEVKDGTALDIFIMVVSGDYDADTLETEPYDGKVEISVPYKTENCKVQGYNHNEELVDIASAYKDGAYTFTLSNYSDYGCRFVFSPDTAKKETATKTDVPSDNPKTGASDYVVSMGVMMAACAAAVVMLGKKK